jgi:hypothetical protein
MQTIKKAVHKIIGSKGYEVKKLARILLTSQNTRPQCSLRGLCKGGPARFLASAFAYFGSDTAIHIFDT